MVASRVGGILCTCYWLYLAPVWERFVVASLGGGQGCGATPAVGTNRLLPLQFVNMVWPNASVAFRFADSLQYGRHSKCAVYPMTVAARDPHHVLFLNGK